MVDVRFVAEAKRFLPLDQLRAEPQLADMLLFSRARLSVQPVEDRHLAWIRSAAGM
jgi:predicted RNA-binding protein with PUA-like domain